jgi:membrane protease YdiL (CAAX protease family)/tetratricopeptide (TPR) repeat protein
MRFKNIIRTLLLISNFGFAMGVFAQTLDSKILIKEMENSSNNLYKEYIKKYDDYLKLHPTDIKIQIEKCKFLQSAQYNVEEDYNPNQEAADSCCAALIKSYPNHPDVLIFQTTYKWDDELKNVFATAQSSIEKNPKAWSDKNLGILYKLMSDQSFVDEEFNQAYFYMQKAISKDEAFKLTIENARILQKMKKDKEALKVLLSIKDTTELAWNLTQKADMLLELKAYPEALDLYNKISKIDSSYNNNQSIANTLEKVGQIDLARKCLVSDTALNWQKETSKRNLLIHDLKYENGAKCIDSYNKYRDLGILNDPIGLYRLKVFFSHPLQPWTFRDVIAILLFIIGILLLVLIPSIWILPFYFIGHKWNLISRAKPFESDWGLKSFWFISFGFMFSSFVTFFVEPELLNSLFNSSNYITELSLEKSGLSSVIFILILAFFGFATLYKTNLKVLLSSEWSIKKSILMSLGIMLVYRIISGIYIRIGINFFDVSIDDLACIPQLFLTSRQDIEAIVAFSNKGIAFLLICLLVPIYEEIIFRGVILGSCQRYTNFNIANFIQATLFATVHMNLFLFPLFLSFGIITGNLRKKSGGLLGGIVFHVFNNILAISLLLLKY